MPSQSPDKQRSVTVVLVVIALGWAAAANAASSQTSRGASPIEEFILPGLEHNAEGDYDAAREVWTRFEKKHPAHPAANVYATETLYWRMMHEEGGTRFDHAVAHECDEAIRKAAAWVEARPFDAAGYFYLGQALMHRGRLHGLRARIFEAWRFGERGRRTLERALELDPGRADAKLPIGLYYYYASLVPDFFGWLSFLWFVPTGKGDQGIAYIEEVSRSDGLHRMAAAFHLANIRSEHADRLDHDWAHSEYRRMHERYPHNAIVHFQLLEALEMRQEYGELVLEARVLEAHPGRGREQRGAAAMARIWRARGEMMLHRIDAAWKTLSGFADDEPKNPDWGARWVMVTRAQLLDLRGERDRAINLYQGVLELDLVPMLSRAPSIALAGLDRPFSLGSATAR